MGHILRFARRTGRDTLTIDFVKREAGPPELLAAPMSDLLPYYMEQFWDLVKRHGSEPSLVKSATLVLRYRIETEWPHAGAPQFRESPYACDVRITDTRGKEYIARFRGSWYPERLDDRRKEMRPWWKFWTSGTNLN